MSSQESVEQIIEKKARRARWWSRRDVSAHIDDLTRSWQQNRQDIGPFQDFIPMRLATLLEVFTRELVREIIDTGSPYVERAAQISKGAKLDFVFAMNLHGKKISLGEFVSHSLSLNGISQITSVLESLLPGYREQLASVQDRWAVEMNGQPERPIISDIDKLFFHLSKLFEVRHIITHEIPANPPYASDDLASFLSSTKEFLDATDWYVTDKLEGKVPLTQLDMNFSAGETLEASLKELGTIYERVKKVEGLDAALLKDSQQKWEVYAECESTLRASLVEGGSMHPMVYASAKTVLTDRRVEDLRWWLEREEGEV